MDHQKVKHVLHIGRSKSLPGLSRVEVEDAPLRLRSRPSLPGSLLTAALPPALPNGAALPPSLPPSLPAPALRPSSPSPCQDDSHSSAVMDKGPPRDVSPNLSRSRTEKFHKLFKSVPTDEEPIDYFSCAYKGDILLQGLMYLSANWICFHSKIKGRGRLLEISMDSVISITREKMALIFPNAIGIQTANEKYVFGSFMGRDTVYKLLINLWKSTQDTEKALTAKPSGLSLCNGQTPSPFDSLSEEQDSHLSGEGNVTDQEEMEEDTGLHMRAVPYTDSSADPPTPAKCPKPPYPEKCWNLSRTLDAFCQSAIKLQNIPRTNLLIAVCSILVFFLLVSAVCLTYKILVLQSQIEMQHLWNPAIKHKYRDQVMSHMYHLQLESHMATVKQLHTVLKANIDLLQEMHGSLKSLQKKGLTRGSQEEQACSTQQCPGET